MAKKDLEQGSPALEGVGPAEQPARPGDSETPHVQGAVKTGFQGAREASGSSSERGTRGALRAKQGGRGVTSMELFCPLGSSIWAPSSQSSPGASPFWLWL